MTYHKRLLLLALIDTLIVSTSLFISIYILYPKMQVIPILPRLILSIVTLIVSHHTFASIYKLYKRAWEYASIGELVVIFKAITLSVFMTSMIQYMTFGSIYYRMLAVTWMLHMLLIGGSRFSWRIYRDTFMKSDHQRKKTLIIGAGAAGTMVAKQLLHSRDTDLYPVAFIDDDPKKYRLEVLGVPVLGGVERIREAVRNLQIEHIIIAIPSLGRRELRRIFEECTKSRVKTQILPMIEDLVSGKISIKEFRDVEVEDLLGREPVVLDTAKIAEYVADKVILVTGAGGSIGSEICRQVARFHPKCLILLGHGENSIYNIEIEMKRSYRGLFEIIPKIADVQDRSKIFRIMEKYRPDVLFHAAAHKHVPLMERNPEEAIKNNVIGTKNVAEAADAYAVETFVMISTDKAVNPTSVMGASKRMAEMIIQDMAQRSQTRFVAVRFGNVLGSRGSVIPLFKEQIRRGGPVTVTHPDMVRYFMTIPEASRLVLQAGGLAKGGEIFVLDMGEPVKIVDLARNLIQLSGYSVEEIGIEYTGIRPGEKLYEELLSCDEVHEQQIYPKIYVGKSINYNMKEIEHFLIRYVEMNPEQLRMALLEMTNFVPNPHAEVSVI